jgi:hypothetical protein
MPDKEASMEPKQEGRWELRDGIWFAIKGTEGPLYNSAWMREEVNDLEARLAAAEQQAQTLRTALSYAVEALDTDRWKSILGTDWMAEAKAALNLQSAGASDE